MQPGFPTIEQRPVSPQPYEAPMDERLYRDLDKVEPEHLSLIDVGRSDIAAAIHLMQIHLLHGIEPHQTRLLLNQESAG